MAERLQPTATEPEVQMADIDLPASAQAASPLVAESATESKPPASTKPASTQPAPALASSQPDAQPESTEPASTEQSASQEHAEGPSAAPESDEKGTKDQDALSIGPDPSEQPLICTITLLLPTGARHPYKIDEKYLAKRSVEIPDVTASGRKDPFSISVYKLKELILREWRDEWDGKPASPSSIRLIFFGKLLDDKEQLKKYQFSPDSPNIVHMSVRPPDMMEEDEAAKGKSSPREGRSRQGGGCCVIL